MGNAFISPFPTCAPWSSRSSWRFPELPGYTTREGASGLLGGEGRRASERPPGQSLGSKPACASVPASLRGRSGVCLGDCLEALGRRWAHAQCHLPVICTECTCLGPRPQEPSGRLCSSCFQLSSSEGPRWAGSARRCPMASRKWTEPRPCRCLRPDGRVPHFSPSRLPCQAFSDPADCRGRAGGEGAAASRAARKGGRGAALRPARPLSPGRVRCAHCRRRVSTQGRRCPRLPGPSRARHAVPGRRVPGKCPTAAAFGGHRRGKGWAPPCTPLPGPDTAVSSLCAFFRAALPWRHLGQVLEQR